VSPEKALDHVVRACNLMATRYQLGGAPDTYLVTRPGAVVPQTLPRTPSAGDPVDIAIGVEVPLSSLAVLIGRLGQFNVVVAPDVASRKMAIQLSRMPAESVVHLVAAAMGLTVDVSHDRPSTRTYLLVPSSAKPR
jgi:hypothetical protein